MAFIVLMVAGIAVLLLGAVALRHIWGSFSVFPTDPVQKMSYDLLQSIACLLAAGYVAGIGVAIAQFIR
jgi:hypothetical protein